MFVGEKNVFSVHFHDFNHRSMLYVWPSPPQSGDRTVPPLQNDIMMPYVGTCLPTAAPGITDLFFIIIVFHLHSVV